MAAQRISQKENKETLKNFYELRQVNLYEQLTESNWTLQLRSSYFSPVGLRISIGWFVGVAGVVVIITFYSIVFVYVFLHTYVERALRTTRTRCRVTVSEYEFLHAHCTQVPIDLGVWWEVFLLFFCFFIYRCCLRERRSMLKAASADTPCCIARTDCYK